MKVLLSTLTILILFSGCAANDSLNKPSVLSVEPSPRPPRLAVATYTQGSLMPQTNATPLPMRSLFQDKRPSQVGDIITVVLNETTLAKKAGGTSAGRTGRSGVGIQADSSNKSNLLRLGVDGGGSFDGSGTSSASNEVSGTITVTVMEIFPNGNLRVEGAKRIAVGAEEEVIRFGGVISPLTIKGNTVLSTQVADVRIEYRGAGITDQVQRPGWLTQFMTRFGAN